MDFNEGMEHLRSLYKDKEWFHSVGSDQYGRYVVYVHHMCEDNLRNVVDNVGKIQVLVHFAGSLFLDKDKYVNRIGGPTIPALVIEKEPENVVELNDDEEKSLLHLQNELERLEKICGSYTLQDIFYEIQDGKNAVTNLSARYPEVRKGLEKLFQIYGFDVIYEELDG